jgi:hypothetical protein
MDNPLQDAGKRIYFRTKQVLFGPSITSALKHSVLLNHVCISCKVNEKGKNSCKLTFQRNIVRLRP